MVKVSISKCVNRRGNPQYVKEDRDEIKMAPEWQEKQL